MCARAAARSHLPSPQSGPPPRCSPWLRPLGGEGCPPKPPRSQPCGWTPKVSQSACCCLLSACPHRSRSCHPSITVPEPQPLRKAPQRGTSAPRPLPSGHHPFARSQAPHVPTSQHLPEPPCPTASPPHPGAEGGAALVPVPRPPCRERAPGEGPVPRATPQGHPHSHPSAPPHRPATDPTTTLVSPRPCRRPPGSPLTPPYQRAVARPHLRSPARPGPVAAAGAAPGAGPAPLPPTPTGRRAEPLRVGPGRQEGTGRAPGNRARNLRSGAQRVVPPGGVPAAAAAPRSGRGGDGPARVWCRGPSRVKDKFRGLWKEGAKHPYSRPGCSGPRRLPRSLPAALRAVRGRSRPARAGGAGVPARSGSAAAWSLSGENTAPLTHPTVAGAERSQTQTRFVQRLREAAVTNLQNHSQRKVEKIMIQSL